jgi:hypothetical protein
MIAKWGLYSGKMRVSNVRINKHIQYLIMNDIRCVLCDNANTEHLHRDELLFEFIRDYYHCKECYLVFVPPDQRLQPEVEFSRYEEHQNHPEDPDYRKFLSRLSQPLLERMEPESYGLDFGSGPGPTLSIMLEEAGHKVELFDIFYANNPAVFKYEYDFITSTETVEHLFDPLGELNRLWSCLRKGGWLGIMTQRVGNVDEFINWYYKNDDTHVVFFSDETFLWLGRLWGVTPEFVRNDVVFFKKQ